VRSTLLFCLFVFYLFCLQEELAIHADNEVLLQLMISPVTEKIIHANDFIFVIDWNRFCVALHQAENASIAPYSMFYSFPKNIYVFS
jgi:hypothetical protein